MAAFAGPAAADTRFTEPGASGPEPCNPAPCSIHDAIQNAADGDEVVVRPGSYGSPSARLADPILSIRNIVIAGVAGQPRPVIYSSATPGLSLGDPLSELRFVEVDSTGAQGLFMGGRLADQVIARTSADGSSACYAWSGTLLNSICHAAGTGSHAVEFTAGAGNCPSGPQPFADSILRGVTAWAPGTLSDGVSIANFCGAQKRIALTNTIAQGGGNDLHATTDSEPGTEAQIDVGNSNFDTAQATGTGAAIDQGDGNQSAAPQLANPGAGDFRQVLGSPTVDAGLTSSDNGGADFEGTPRVQGEDTDIGADELVPAPAAFTGSAYAIFRTSATVQGLVTPRSTPTSYRFDYGTTTGYGQSTPVRDAGSGSTQVEVTEVLTGLTAGTTYHYRLVAANATGATGGGDRAFTTPAASPPAVSVVDPRPDVFRLGNKLPAVLTAAAKRAPVGTSILIAMNEPGTIKLSFRQRLSGRRVGKRCRRPSRSNRNGRRCIRKVGRGAFNVPGVAGSNYVRFQGRISSTRRLGVGSYDLAVVLTDAFGRKSKALRSNFRIVR
jgi:hypothetical protein